MVDRETVISTLLEECPKFHSIFDVEDGPYTILGEFAIYLCEGIENSSIPPRDIESSFKFLNNMGNTNDIEVQNQLVVGVLEKFTYKGGVRSFFLNYDLYRLQKGGKFVGNSKRKT